MYEWECRCFECGHEFDYIWSYAPIVCEECLSEELERTFLGRAYDW